MDCIFCKIINKELKSEILLENEKAIVFYDIHPKAPFHVLIVPKIHIESIKSDGSEQIVSDLIETAKEVANQQDIAGYKLVFNVGKDGGQEVEHLHMHMLSGRPVSLP
jgi:histidine triad (HIT) family protein